MTENRCFKAIGLAKLRNFVFLFTLLLLFFYISSLNLYPDSEVVRPLLLLTLFSFLLSFAVVIWFKGFPKCYLIITDSELKIPDASFYKWSGTYLSIPVDKIKDVDVDYGNEDYFLKITIDGAYTTKKSIMILGHIQYSVANKGSLVVYRIYGGDKKALLSWKNKLTAITGQDHSE